MNRSSLGQHRRASRSWPDPDGCDYVIKAILLGDLGVGKTSFLDAFMRGGCCPSQQDKAPGRPSLGQAARGPKNIPCACNPDRASWRSRIGQSGKQRMLFCPYHAEGTGALHGRRSGAKQDSGKRTVMYQGKRIALTLWDTAGQERYRSMTQSYYRGAHACIVMYDEHDEESFDNVTMWLDSVQDYRDTASAGIQTLLVGNVRSGHSGHSAPTSYSQVNRQRVQTLAAHHAIPFFLVDSRADLQSVEQVVESLVTLVMTQAVGNQHLSQSITPYSTKLQQLAKKSRQSSCGRCCVIL